tara:strand:- start:17958 stop:23846 length:5889 start_codon:yes stop_codon:yes gene_type:complete
MTHLLRKTSLFLGLLAAGTALGQALQVTGPANLQAQLGAPISLNIAITTPTNIPNGSPINAKIRVLRPDGSLAQNGDRGTEIQNGGLNVGAAWNIAVVYDIPWREGEFWAAGANWSLEVEASAPGSAVSSSGIQTFPFSLILPDLQVLSNMASTPRPGQFIDLTGTVANVSTAPTEPGIPIVVTATGADGFSGSTTLTPPILGNDPGVPFTIPAFRIDPAANGATPITFSVNGITPRVIWEQDHVNNNQLILNLNVNVGAADLQTSTDFLINGDREGAFQGRDSVRCTVSFINVGTGAVQAGDAFDFRVFLSNDQTVSNDDFLLREVDLGGSSIGLGLETNETITLDWVQMLPDNFEGDFYVISDLNGVPLTNRTSPGLSIRSENVLSIEMDSPAGAHHHARPSSSLDGKIMAHETLANGLTQIQMINKTNGQSTVITTPIGQGAPDGSSFAPVISSNGKFIVFHSHATNLVPGDTNGHVDVFRYEVFNGRLTRLSLGQTGEEGNGGSFYPAVSDDGTKVAFESHATNLISGQAATSGKQIFLWTESNGTAAGAGTGVVTAVTNGNAASIDASISGDGQRIVFTTYADNLVVSEADTNKNSDVVLWENGQFYFAGRAEDGSLPVNGATREPVLSSNGEVISFVSSARNMVKGKGVAYVHIEDAGVGYAAGSTVQLTDINGSGASIIVSSLNPYGEILAFSIDNPGRNYVNPTLTVLTPPGSSPPDRNVSAVPLLVNPDGDVFRIAVSAVKAGSGSERISESPPLDGDPGSETGGKLGSREPSISRDGSAVAYSSRAPNLLELNASSSNTKVFANNSFRVARARAVLEGGIRQIEITSGGTGYLRDNNTLSIDDLSGHGSGAVARYRVVGGQVVDVILDNPGTNYDLNQTVVTIQNDPSGTGASFRIWGGGSTIQRIEMVDSGTGYPSSLNQSLEPAEIIIDGDGDDLDGDGRPDARLNPDRLFTGSNGEVYLEQQIDIAINNRTSLVGSTLIIGDLNRTLTLGFASTPSGPFVLGADFIDPAGTIAQTDTGLRDTIISTIRSFWSNPTNLYGGPLFENNVTAGNGFTIRALNGTARTDNPSALLVSYKSNMLVGGSGFTRATPFLSPAPIIYGFSEVQPLVSSATTNGARPLLGFQEDLLTDDIYYFNQITRRNSRVSLSKFGYPTNYLASTALPSHRYPSISGDGRYVFFSSDAGGQGGLIFGSSNQNPQDTTPSRSVYSVDLKSTKLPENNSDYVISISTNLLAVTESSIYLSRPFPVMVEASAKKGSLGSLRLYVDGVQVGANNITVQGTRNHKTFFDWTPSRLGTHEIVASVINNINEEIFSSPVQVEVIAPSINTALGGLTIRPAGVAGQTTQGSSLLASVEFTGSNGKKAHVGSVAFYLNDKLLGTHTDPPFSTAFSPPAYEGNTSLSSWSLSALAKDLNGSTFITSRSGQIQGSSVLPTLTLSPINTITGLSDNEVFDKQRVTLEASIQGDSDALALVQTVGFYGNGFLLGANVTGVPITTASGQITSIEYQFDWDVDFARYAKPDGTVEIVVLGDMTPVGGFTPVFSSTPLVVRISPPTPWLNEKSTALSIFSDLSESNMSTRQVEALLHTINSGGQDVLETWVNELSEVASFQQKMSIIGAHQICMGEWHDSFINLETDFNNFIPTGAVNTNWLKTYADHVLNSDQYISKYGVVDYLVGYENEKDIHDFDQNRRAFAERCLFNKYGSSPSFQQMFQGSKRMVYFYYNLVGKNYWEVRTQQQNNNQGGGGGNQATQFSPPRLDSLTNNAYVAGECAVEFVAKLTEEVPIDDIAYVVYTEPLRKSTYKVATLAQLLWRENADPVQDADIQRLAGMPITEAIKSILNDYRYTSRFNLIWKESAVVDSSTPSWKKEDWFGYFWDRHFPWVYHEKLGWIYIAGVSPTQFWFHHATLGWLWTGAAHYPNVYSNSEQNWIYFSSTSQAYYSHGSQAWKTY